MRITVYEEAATFVAASEDYLLQAEVASALMIGIAQHVADGGDYSEHPPFFATYSDSDGSLVGAAVMTPPFNVIVSAGAPSAALSDLCTILRDGDWSVPGVIGPKDEAKAFAAAWTQATDQPHTVGMNQRVYELRAVIPPARPASGQLRRATLDEIDLITDWMYAFLREALPKEPPSDRRATAERLIGGERIAIWEDGGEAVSMAANTRPAGRGIAINAVYTPPENRRKGYASSCVAALSQLCMDEGYAYCTLFTDLDNPTSNNIYMQIGYEPVCDFTLLLFGDV